jgi:hypothetical protein
MVTLLICTINRHFKLMQVTLPLIVAENIQEIIKKQWAFAHYSEAFNLVLHFWNPPASSRGEGNMAAAAGKLFTPFCI